MAQLRTRNNKTKPKAKPKVSARKQQQANIEKTTNTKKNDTGPGTVMKTPQTLMTESLMKTQKSL